MAADAANSKRGNRLLFLICAVIVGGYLLFGQHSSQTTSKVAAAPSVETATGPSSM